MTSEVPIGNLMNGADMLLFMAAPAFSASGAVAVRRSGPSTCTGPPGSTR